MAVEYPAAWASLRFPQIRGELIAYLSEIAGQASDSGRYQDSIDIDQIFHFFFDDTDLGSPDRTVIGEIVFDAAEERAIRSVTTALDKMLRELGDQPTAAYLGHSDWKGLARTAEQALSVLRPRGSPRYF